MNGDDADSNVNNDKMTLSELGIRECIWSCRAGEQAGSVALDSFREIERYSHVMHISSTVKG